MKEKFDGPPGQVVCGHSFQLADLSTSFQLHFAPEAEIEANGGVCAACKEKFRTNHHNSAAITGAAETPAKFSELHIVTIEDDHAAYVAPGPGGVDGVVDFSFEDIDAALGTVEDESKTVRADTAALFASLMSWVWSGGSIKRAMVKFAALTASIRPDLMMDQTFAEIGKELGVTKQCVSKASLLFSDKFGINWARSRSTDARENMRLARLAQPPRKKRSTAPPIPAT